MSSNFALYSIFAVHVLAGLGFVLLGLRLFSESLQYICGRGIKWALEIIAKSAVGAVFAGLLVSLFVQSGTVTSLMAVSYASAGQLSLSQLGLFLLGSNLGTAPTAFLFMVRDEWFAFLFAGLGVLPMFYARRALLSSFGRGLVGLGLVLLGSQFLQVSFIRAEGSLFLEPMISSLSASAFLFLAAVVLSLILRSSIALLGITAALVAGDWITSAELVATIVGVNMGTTIPLMLASRKSGLRARRGALFHFGSNVLVGFILIFFWQEFIGGVHDFWALFPFQLDDIQARLFVVPTGHFVFNVFVLALNMFLLPFWSWLAMKLIPETGEKEMQKLTVIGPLSHLSATLALEQATQEVKKMSAMVESILQLTKDIFSNDEVLESRNKVIKYEKITDNIYDEVHDFLGQVMQSHLSAQQAEEIRSLLRISKELEAISDKCCFVVHKFVKLTEGGVSLSEAEQKHLQTISEQVLFDYEIVFTAMMEPSKNIDDFQSEELVKFNQKNFTQRVTEDSYITKIGEIEARAKSEGKSFSFMVESQGAFNQVRLHSQNIYQSLGRL